MYLTLFIPFFVGAETNTQCRPNLSPGARVISVGTLQDSLVAATATKVMCEVYASLGYRLQVKPLPGRRTLKLSNNGTLDGELVRIASIPQEYPNLIIVKPSLFDIEGIAFVLDKAITIESVDDLKGKKIGIIRGIKWARQLTLNEYVFETSGVFHLMKLLQSGRVDLVLATKRSGGNILKTAFPNMRVKYSPVLMTVPVFHFINKKNKKLKAKLTESLIALDKSGRKAQLIKTD